MQQPLRRLSRRSVHHRSRQAFPAAASECCRAVDMVRVARVVWIEPHARALVGIRRLQIVHVAPCHPSQEIRPSLRNCVSTRLSSADHGTGSTPVRTHVQPGGCVGSGVRKYRSVCEEIVEGGACGADCGLTPREVEWLVHRSLRQTLTKMAGLAWNRKPDPGRRSTPTRCLAWRYSTRLGLKRGTVAGEGGAASSR